MTQTPCGSNINNFQTQRDTINPKANDTLMRVVPASREWSNAAKGTPERPLKQGQTTGTPDGRYLEPSKFPTYPSSSAATSFFHHGVLKQVCRGGTSCSGNPRFLARTADRRTGRELISCGVGSLKTKFFFPFSRYERFLGYLTHIHTQPKKNAWFKYTTHQHKHSVIWFINKYLLPI